MSTDEQDLARQELIVREARAAGYYVAGVYREKASRRGGDRGKDRLRGFLDASSRRAITKDGSMMYRTFRPEFRSRAAGNSRRRRALLAS